MLKRTIVLAAVVLSACSSADVRYRYPERINGRYVSPAEQDEAGKSGKLLGDSLTFKFDFPKQGDVPEPETAPANKVPPATEKQNADVWRGVLPALAAYPVSIATDSFVSTDWFTEEGNATKEFKINVVRNGEDADVTVLCRVKDGNGDRITQKNDQKLADKIKNDIVRQSNR